MTGLEEYKAARGLLAADADQGVCVAGGAVDPGKTVLHIVQAGGGSVAELAARFRRSGIKVIGGNG